MVKKVKCLVTGGAGFIGSHIVERLLADGHTVEVIDNLSLTNNFPFFCTSKNVNYNILNIKDYAKIARLFKGIDIVFHLASETSVTNSFEEPGKTCSTNIIGTCNVLQAAKEFHIKRVVFSSTSACYGVLPPPHTENSSVKGLSPYSISKITCEQFTNLFFQTWNLPIINLRYFNVYGERMPMTGQYAPVIGCFLKQKKAGKKITVVGDGSQIRDFVYVKDVVEANIKAAFTENIKCLGETFNVGTGTGYTILQIAKFFTNNDVTKIKFLPPRAGEVRSSISCNKKVKTLLKFQTQNNLFDWLNKQLCEVDYISKT